MRRLNRKRYNIQKRTKAVKENKVKMNKHFNDDSEFEADKITIPISKLRFGNITHGNLEYMTVGERTIIMNSWEKYIVSCIELLYIRMKNNSELFFATLAAHGVLSVDILIALENIADTYERKFDYAFEIHNTGYKLFISDMTGKTLYPSIIGLAMALELDVENITFTISRKSIEKEKNYKIVLGNEILAEGMEPDVIAYLLVNTMYKIVEQQTMIESSSDGLRIATVPEYGATEIKGAGIYMWFSGDIEDLKEYVSKLNMFVEEELKII